MTVRSKIIRHTTLLAFLALGLVLPPLLRPSLARPESHCGSLAALRADLAAERRRVTELSDQIRRTLAELREGTHMIPNATREIRQALESGKSETKVLPRSSITRLEQVRRIHEEMGDAVEHYAQASTTLSEHSAALDQVDRQLSELAARSACDDSTSDDTTLDPALTERLDVEARAALAASSSARQQVTTMDADIHRRFDILLPQSAAARRPTLPRPAQRTPLAQRRAAIIDWLLSLDEEAASERPAVGAQ
jgi:hypothetical protein